MATYDLLEYSQNYSVTSGNLWNYYRDKIDNVNHNPSDGKLFEYKIKTIGKWPQRPAQPNTGKNGKPRTRSRVTISLKYIGNIWRSLDFLW